MPSFYFLIIFLLFLIAVNLFSNFITKLSIIFFFPFSLRGNAVACRFTSNSFSIADLTIIRIDWLQKMFLNANDLNARNVFLITAEWEVPFIELKINQKLFDSVLT